MNHETTQDIAAFFDACALRGDMADFAPEDLPKLEALLRLWDIRPGARVLEVGCGAGRLTARVAEAVGPTGEVVAMDLSGEMIRLAAQRGLPENVHFVQGDVRQAPRPDGWFDCVLCFCVLPHLQPLAPALAEMARVARPGARLWVCHLMSRARINSFHRNIGSTVAGHGLPPDDVIQQALERAGFRLLSLTDSEEEGYRLEAVRAGGDAEIRRR